jgi:hypothetical protein
MKTSIDNRQFDIAKVTFNGALQQVQDLNWYELKDLTKSSLLKYMSDLLILRSDYILTEDQKRTIAIAEERLIKYISKSYDKRKDQ